MIAMAITSILAAIAWPTYSSFIEGNKVDMAMSDITMIEMRIETYSATNQGFPPDLATIGVTKEDPWGNPYQYLNMDTVNGNGQKRKDHNLVPINTDYDLYSMGPDGASVGPLTAQASRDDIIRANNGEFIGEATDY